MGKPPLHCNTVRDSPDMVRDSPDMVRDSPDMVRDSPDRSVTHLTGP